MPPLPWGGVSLTFVTSRRADFWKCTHFKKIGTGQRKKKKNGWTFSPFWELIAGNYVRNEQNLSAFVATKKTAELKRKTFVTGSRNLGGAVPKMYDVL